MRSIRARNCQAALVPLQLTRCDHVTVGGTNAGLLAGGGAGAREADGLGRSGRTVCMDGRGLLVGPIAGAWWVLAGAGSAVAWAEITA